MKYVYSVAEHPFVVTRSAECPLWCGEIASAYADFELASADETNLLFHLQVEYGEIVLLLHLFSMSRKCPLQILSLKCGAMQMVPTF